MTFTFKRLKNDVKDGGREVERSIGILKKLPSICSNAVCSDAVNECIVSLEEHLVFCKDEYQKRINEVEQLVGKCWKVTEIMAGGEEYPLCYMFVYEINELNDIMFTLVSPSHILFTKEHTMNYHYCGNFSLCEKSFDFMELGENICGVALRFDECDETTMQSNAEILCGKVFKRIKEKMNEKPKYIIKDETIVLD